MSQEETGERVVLDLILYTIYSMQMNRIKKTALRDQVHEILTERILSWAYPPDAVLRDTVIAEELDVSRTPVREALLQLAHDGLVDQRQGLGFSVRPLCRKEVEETYPILWTLECLALSLSPGPDAETQKELDRLNHLLETADEGPVQRMEVDIQWHATLLRGCPNHRLREMIAGLRKLVRRHEILYMRAVDRVEESLTFHGKIMQALHDGDLRSASRLLEEHWKTSLEVRLAMHPGP